MKSNSNQVRLPNINVEKTVECRINTEFLRNRASGMSLTRAIMEADATRRRLLSR